MKYIVTDPENGKIVATYEKSGTALQFYEAAGSPFLKRNESSRARTLIDAVLQSHRDEGRIVSVE